MQKIKGSVQLSIILSLLTFVTTIFTNFSCSKSTPAATIIGDWAHNGDIDPANRTQAATFQIGDSVYLCGGFNGTTRLSDLWVYNWNTQTWSRRAAFPGTPRSSAVGFSANGNGYIATGFDGVNMLGDCWQFTPTTNSWKRVADFANATTINTIGSTPRYGAVAFSLNNIGYVGTGYDGSYTKDFYAYNPTTNTWSQAPSLGGEKRSNAAVFIYNNTAYVVTGVNNGTYPSDMWSFNPTSNPNGWTQLRQITNVSTDTYDDLYGTNIQRSNATTFVMNNKGYLVFGTHSGVLGTCWEYSFDNTNGGTADTWVQKTTFEGAARQDANGFTVKNQGYVCAGGNGTGYTVYGDIWTFFPTVVANANNN